MNDETAAPDPHGQCMEVLRQHASEGGAWPQEMPEGYDAAAVWWLGIIAPTDMRWDKPYVRQSKHGTVTRYPYIERAVYTLRRFLQCSSDFQRLIVRASEDGIYWRGDDESMFRRILSEHARMEKIGLDAYRAETRAKANRFTRSVVSRGGTQ